MGLAVACELESVYTRIGEKHVNYVKTNYTVCSFISTMKNKKKVWVGGFGDSYYRRRQSISAQPPFGKGAGPRQTTSFYAAAECVIENACK